MTAPILLRPIGQNPTPWKTLADCPSGPGRGREEARLDILPEYAEGLHALAASELDLLYWFDRAARDVLRSVSPHDGVERGVFAMRSPSLSFTSSLRCIMLSIWRSTSVRTAGRMRCLKPDRSPAGRLRSIRMTVPWT